MLTTELKTWIIEKEDLVSCKRGLLDMGIIICFKPEEQILDLASSINLKN